MMNKDALERLRAEFNRPATVEEIKRGGAILERLRAELARTSDDSARAHALKLLEQNLADGTPPHKLFLLMQIAAALRDEHDDEPRDMSREIRAIVRALRGDGNER